jgi:hypothetical protein
MTQNPDILVIPGGAQFLTAPDGTTSPDVAGLPVDLTGVPLTAARSYVDFHGAAAQPFFFAAGVLSLANLLPGNLTPDMVGKRMSLVGAQEGFAATVSPLGPDFLVTGLVNIVPSDAGRFLVIKGSAFNDGVFQIKLVVSPTSVVIASAFGAFEVGVSWRRSSFPSGAPTPVDVNTGNAGIFDITAAGVSLASLSNPAGHVPDQWQFEIEWQVLPALADFPAGDPITNVAERQYIPLNVVTPAPGPARFGDYDPRLPPLVTNQKGDVFSKAQVAGAGDPTVVGTGGVGSRVDFTDPQQPVRFTPSAAIPNMPDGQAQVMTDGPAVTQLGRFVAVPDPALKVQRL